MGLISPTYLRTNFTPVAPKSIRIQSSCQYLLTLLGYTGAIAACRTLMKLTHGVDFTNILHEIFLNESALHIFSLLQSQNVTRKKLRKALLYDTFSSC